MFRRPPPSLSLVPFHQKWVKKCPKSELEALGQKKKVDVVAVRVSSLFPITSNSLATGLRRMDALGLKRTGNRSETRTSLTGFIYPLALALVSLFLLAFISFVNHAISALEPSKSHRSVFSRNPMSFLLPLFVFLLLPLCDPRKSPLLDSPVRIDRAYSINPPHLPPRRDLAFSSISLGISYEQQRDQIPRNLARPDLATLAVPSLHGMGLFPRSSYVLTSPCPFLIYITPWVGYTWVPIRPRALYRDR